MNPRVVRLRESHGPDCNVQDSTKAYNILYTLLFEHTPKLHLHTSLPRSNDKTRRRRRCVKAAVSEVHIVYARE